MRYNTLVQFENEWNSTIIKAGNHSIKIKYDKNIYNFLKYIKKNIYFSKETIEDFNITKNLIRLFLKLSIISNTIYNSWIESLDFDKTIRNPSKTFIPLNENSLNNIYWNIYKNFIEAINKWDRKAYSQYKRKKITISCNWKRYSTRKKANIINKKIKINDMLSANNKILWNGKENLLYGSGWWMYSVSSVMIHNTDNVYLLNKHKKKYIYKHIPWIFKEYTDICLINDPLNDFRLYEYHIILFSVFKSVFNKYWNRWYRYIQIESWAIGCLRRNYLCSKSIPYLELQWFIENNIYALFEKNNILNTNNVLITHTICCW